MKQLTRNQTKSLRCYRYILAVIFLSAFFLIPFGSFTLAQKTDFSGEWTLNESGSDMGEGRFRMSKAIKVTQAGNDFELERTRTGRDGQEMTSTEKLTLDGEVTVTERENRSTESTVTWSEDGKSITISSKTTMSRQGETFEMSSTEIWTLDKKANLLTIGYSGSSPRGSTKATLVYDKK